MADDPAKKVADHVAVAIEMLTKSLPQTKTLRDRLVLLERDELQQHNPITALYALSSIIRGLEQLKAPRPGVATGVAKLEQDKTPVSLPGVDDAIDQLEKALEVLNRVT